MVMAGSTSSAPPCAIVRDGTSASPLLGPLLDEWGGRRLSNGGAEEVAGPRGHARARVLEVRRGGGGIGGAGLRGRQCRGTAGTAQDR